MARLISLVPRLSFLLVLFMSCLTPSAFATGSTLQTISLQPIADQVIGVAPFQVIAIASTNLPLVYTVSGPAVLNRRLLKITGPGTVTLHVHQDGNDTYSAADAEESFQVKLSAPSLAWTPPSLIYGATVGASMRTATASAPPVVSLAADAATFTGPFTSSQITGGTGVTVTPDSPIFRYEGEFLAPSTAPNDHGGYVPIANSLRDLAVQIAFTCDCDQFEFKVQSRSSQVQLWVDGDFTSDLISQTNEYPKEFYYLVQFPDRRQRQIKVRLYGGPPFYGVVVPPGELASAPQYPLGDLVVIFGDSWTGPTISPNKYPPPQAGLMGNGYPQWLGTYFNWDYFSSSDGGEGFVNGGTTNTDFGQRILDEDVCGLNPAMMVIVGGANDSDNYAGVLEGATRVFSELSACLPQGPVFVVGPQNNAPDNARALHDAAALYPGMVHYEDMLDDQWFYGDINNPGDGNNWDFTGQTVNGYPGHPTPDGHDFLAARIEWFMQTAVPGLTSPTFFTEAAAPVDGTYSYSVDTQALLPAGQNAVTVEFTPSDTVNYAQATQQFTVAVSKATSATTLTAPASATTGAPVSFLATVAPQIAGIPSGMITISAGGNSIGSFSLTNGQAQIPGIFLSGGQQSLTASYSGDSNFLPSTSPSTAVVVTPVDFTLQSPSTASLTATAPAAIAVTVTPMGPLTASLNLTCSGLPAGATCALRNSAGGASTTVAINQQPVTATVVITEASNTAVAKNAGRSGPWLGFVLFGMLPTPLLLLVRGHRQFKCALLVTSASAAWLALAGCGSSQTTAPAIPATHYTVQITLTNTVDPQMTHSQQIDLTVN